MLGNLQIARDGPGAMDLLSELGSMTLGLANILSFTVIFLLDPHTNTNTHKPSSDKSVNSPLSDQTSQLS